MIKKNSTIILALLTVFCLVAQTAQSQVGPKFGIRAGIGTDISGGIAYGGGANYLISFPKASL